MSAALRFSLLSCLGVVLVLELSPGYSAPPSKTEFVQTLVRRALEHEVEGNLAKRQDLLEWALKKDKEHATAHWLLGQLKYQDQWQDYRQVPPQEAKRPEVQEYRKLRQPQPKTAADHLKLADWCREHNLPLREQAHLIAALELSQNPNNVKLRAVGASVRGRRLDDSQGTRREPESSRANRSRRETLAAETGHPPAAIAESANRTA